ncbi:YnfU family zinc-binding protein [Scandinavium sp. M-37]|jgi:ssDNA-binding Zn-finger/Zn-ribbon topoisomerase 1|uniref:YnfU family zinc-binding protein n=1 Tax=Scandinavium sp. M-37 TaxID=3373077 RepID=UPI003746BA61
MINFSTQGVSQKDLSAHGKIRNVKNKKMNEGFSGAIEVLFCANIKGIHMAERKNRQLRPSQPAECSCPKCAKQSMHSPSRIKKNSPLLCPYCGTLFSASQLSAR